MAKKAAKKVTKKAVKKSNKIVLYARTGDTIWNGVDISKSPYKGVPSCNGCGNTCDYCADSGENDDQVNLCSDAAEFLNLKDNKNYKLTITVEEIK